MADRRMFAKTIIDSDSFLDMPMTAQCLYFHLSMRADDDGFINNPRKIQRMIGAGDDDLKLLIAKNFLIVFETGVVVIKHWRIHNYIRSDRYKETVYKEEKELLSLKENGAYTLELSTHTDVGIPNDYQMDTQYRIGKDRIGKDNTNNTDAEYEKPSLDKIKEIIRNNKYRVDADEFYRYYEERNWHTKDGKMLTDLVKTLAGWSSRSKKSYEVKIKPSSGNKYDSVFYDPRLMGGSRSEE